jgi:hypothetical protein
METQKAIYELDFYSALKVVMEGGAVKGNNFAPGIFLKLNGYGQLVTVDAGQLYQTSEKVFLNGMVNQKFREVRIWTKKELAK